MTVRSKPIPLQTHEEPPPNKWSPLLKSSQKSSPHLSGGILLI